ncbi:MAG: hypothetical protein GEU79_08485 [Acidimicrobiia bacterium]|nr:hypothetical protein [Acidimicrobiia bacterium]
MTTDPPFSLYPEETIDLDEMAQLTGASPVLIEALIRQELLVPVEGEVDGLPLFDPSDAESVRAGLALLESGLPLGELLQIAKEANESLRQLADHAVEAFNRFVRDGVEADTPDRNEVGRRLDAAYSEMLPAASRLVGGHFARLLIQGARERLDSRDTDPNLP